MTKRRIAFLLSLCLSMAAVYLLIDRRTDEGADDFTPLASDGLSSGGIVPENGGVEGEGGERLVDAQAALQDGKGSSIEQEVLLAFADWAERYVREEPGEARSKLVDEGASLAAARRQVMRQMIQDDPEKALKNAVPWSVREELPALIAAQLEERVNARGNLAVLGIAPLPGAALPERPVLRTFETETDRFDAFVYGERLGDRTRRNVSANGIVIDNLMAMNESPVRLLDPGEPVDSAREFVSLSCLVSGKEAPETPTFAPLDEEQGVIAASGDKNYFLCSAGHIGAAEDDEGDSVPGAAGIYKTLGERTVLVIRTTFAFPEPGEDEEPPPEPVSVDEAHANMVEVDEHFRLASFQQFSFKTIHVTETAYNMGNPNDYWNAQNNTNNPDLLMERAREAARGDGFEVEYDFVVVSFPNIGFPWGGLGYVGAKGSWVQGSDLNRKVTAHELGHNFGLFHARYWKPLGPVMDYATEAAQAIEYGNVFDVMGSGPFPEAHFGGNFKSILSWLPAPFVHTIPDEASTASYRIHRVDGGASLRDPNRYSARIINSSHASAPEVPRKDYWLDFRQLGGSERSENGVVVQWGNGANGSGGTSKGSHLLNMNPVKWPLEEVADTALAVGETFSDQTMNLHVTPVSRGGFAPHDYINVVVTRGLLKISLMEPVPDPSMINIPGVVDVRIDEPLTVSAAVEASTSDVETVTFHLDEDVLGTGMRIGSTGNYALTVADTIAFGDGEARELVATVQNKAGNTVTSQPINIRFVPPPFEIDLVATPEAVILGESLTVTANVVPESDEVQALEFFANDTLIETVLEAPFTFEWTPEAIGSFELEAIAYGFDGSLKYAIPLTVSVLPDGTEIEMTVSPGEVTLGQPVTLTAVSNVPGDDLIGVTFFADGKEVGESESAPFTIIWTPGLVRSFSLWAEATLADESVKYSAVEVIDVGEPTTTSMAWRSVPSSTEQHLYDIERFGDRFWVVGQHGTILASAPGGEWDVGTAGPGHLLRAVATGDGLLVAAGEGGTIVTTADGGEWTVRESDTTRTFLGLAYGDGKFVAVGDGGRIRTSDDGMEWPAQSSSVANRLNAVAHGAGVFVTVGEDGTVLSSPDGIDWSSRATNTSASLRDVAYGNGRFVAVGGYWDEQIGRNRAVILTSSNGVTWTEREHDISNILQAVHYAAGIFVSAGGGVIASSPDGSYWVTRQAPVAATLHGVSYADDRFLVVGRDGTIIQSLSVGFDVWVTRHFSGAHLTDPEISGPQADPQGKGISNVLRYALGIEAGEDRGRLPTLTTVFDEAARYLKLEYRRPADLPDVQYHVESSVDLSVWQPVEEIGGVIGVETDNGWETVTAQDGVTLGGDGESRFLRLRIEMVD